MYWSHFVCNTFFVKLFHVFSSLLIKFKIRNQKFKIQNSKIKKIKNQKIKNQNSKFIELFFPLSAASGVAQDPPRRVHLPREQAVRPPLLHAHFLGARGHHARHVPPHLQGGSQAEGGHQAELGAVAATSHCGLGPNHVPVSGAAKERVQLGHQQQGRGFTKLKKSC